MLTTDELMAMIVITCRKPSTSWPRSSYNLAYVWIQQKLKQWYTLVMLHLRACHLVDMLIDMTSPFQLCVIEYYKRWHAPNVTNWWIVNLSQPIYMRFINSLLYRSLRYTVLILDDSILLTFLFKMFNVQLTTARHNPRLEQCCNVTSSVPCTIKTLSSLCKKVSLHDTLIVKCLSKLSHVAGSWCCIQTARPQEREQVAS
jgi:hypothetical protein